MHQGTLNPRDVHAVDQMVTAGASKAGAPKAGAPKAGALKTGEEAYLETVKYRRLDERVVALPDPTPSGLDTHERKFMPQGVTTAIKKAHVDSVNEVRFQYGFEKAASVRKPRLVVRHQKTTTPKSVSL